LIVEALASVELSDQKDPIDLSAIVGGYNLPSMGSEDAATSFNQMLSRYNQLQPQTMPENTEMQTAQAF
jgi:hypothetical protein